MIEILSGIMQTKIELTPIVPIALLEIYQTLQTSYVIRLLKNLRETNINCFIYVDFHIFVKVF